MSFVGTTFVYCKVSRFAELSNIHADTNEAAPFARGRLWETPACESVNHALIQQDMLIAVLVVVNQSIYARGNIVFSETMMVAQ